MFKLIVGSFCLLMSVYTCAQEADLPDVRDPTAPLNYGGVGTAQKSDQFALSSILISPQRKVAIVNGSALREGQMVPGSNDVRVQRISTQAVVLQQADKTWVLRLSPSVVKKH